MKITQSYLKQIIKEELKLRVKEGRFGKAPKTNPADEVRWDIESAIDRSVGPYFEKNKEVLTKKGIASEEQLRRSLMQSAEGWLKAYSAAQKASSRSYDDYQDMPNIPPLPGRLRMILEKEGVHIPGFNVANNYAERNDY